MGQFCIQVLKSFLFSQWYNYQLSPCAPQPEASQFLEFKMSYIKPRARYIGRSKVGTMIRDGHSLSGTSPYLEPNDQLCPHQKLVTLWKAFFCQCSCVPWDRIKPELHVGVTKCPKSAMAVMGLVNKFYSRSLGPNFIRPIPIRMTVKVWVRPKD